MQFNFHLFILVIFFAGLCSALPAGREFATSFMHNVGRDGRDTRFLVEVAALPTSQGSTKVKVSAVGEVYEKEIDPGKSVSFKLPDSVEMTGSKKSNQTVLVEASQDVTVMSLNFKKYTADTSVVYPIKDWGTEYIIFTPSSPQTDSFKEFSITNHKEPNTVEVFLKGSVRFQGKYYRRGSKMTIKLEAFESVQVQSQDNLSGTKVVSRLPVAVSSGHSCFQKYTTCNHVYEQLLPVNSWGKEFIIAPLPYHYIFTSHDSVSVQASQSTNITMNVDGQVHSYQMFAGQTFELKSKWPHAMYLTSDKGVQVLFQFNGGPEYTDNYFDPFLMTILPTSQFSTSYSLEGQRDFYNNIIVVAKSKDLGGIKIDPKSQSSNFNWQKVNGTDFSWAEVYYSSGANFYQISHPSSPFGVYSFGVAYANGYGSPASADPAEKHNCSTTKCSEDEVCQMKGKSPICVKKPVIPTGTCWAMGDPHYRTFDGNYYNFMGSCTYTMVKNCQVDGEHPAFEVDAQNNKLAGSKVTFVGKVIIKVYGYTMTIVRSEFGLVRMNYTLWNLPINLDNGKVTLSQSGLSVIVETDFGLTVQYDWKEYLVITVPGSFSGRVCGLCGNFNSKKEDDLVTPNGTQANSVVALGKSWRVRGVPDDAQCQDDFNGQSDTCDSDSFFDSLTDRMFCGLLTHIMNGPLSDCRAVIDPKVFHKMCLYDVCMGEGMKTFLCNTLQVYADACQRAGIKIYDWRSLARCSPPSCPENSHYEFCGNACPATCENPDAATKCNKSCVETCVCDEGFLLSGTKCVPKAQCGCLYKGHYIEAGASFFTDNHCTEKCTCNQTTKTVNCKSPGCHKGFECKVANGLSGCHPMAYAECSMTSGPHFETFDGNNYNFQGTCVYQLAGVCSKDPSLQHFEVLVQNDANGKRVSSGAQLVEVKVYGNSIVITRKHNGLVLINGEITNLPVTHLKNITVNLIGDFAEIKTDFGLQVSYDWHSAVHVKVPGTYADAMCGLCGNFNHNSKDDLQLKNGTEAASVEELGKDWRVAEIPGCVDGCKNKSDCPSCDITQKQKYESDKFCGLIQNPTGPFRECHAIINPDSIFKSCVYNMCLYNGKRGSWCSHLRQYTIKCQQKRVNVSQWRTKDFCPISKMMHPDNSKYEHCGNVCHATCATGLPPSDCKRPCQEGWVCKDGFLLSGHKCVPLEQCGCMQKGKYYTKGQSFLSAGCRQKCTCNGTVQCEPHSCGLFETCEQKNNVLSCQPVGNGTCTISGDPHYKTFDNQYYDFQGTCTYSAAKSCHLEGTRLEKFSVVVENEQWTRTDTPNLSVAKLVAVEVYGHTLILRRNQLNTVMLDGALTAIPLNLDGKVQVFQEGTHYAITTDFGLNVTYDLVYRVTVTVPGNYKGKTCGLCGNFNDNKTDEFQLPTGEVTKNIQTFGEAWKVAVPGVVCENGCAGDQCPKCDSAQKEIFEKDCGIITNPHGPFAACQSRLNPKPYYRDCVYDVCMSHGDRNALCHSISAYMTDCQTIGVKIDNWRTAEFCPINCSANSHYQICSETCASPCPGLTDIITCPTTCAEGCACNEGYYFNGTNCVAQEECGCYYKGRTYKIGESVLSDNCQQRCSCTAFGEVQCEDFSCSATEYCQIKNGIMGCHPKQCRIEAGGSITLFSGPTGTIAVMGAYEIITHCNQSSAEWFRVVVKLQECSVTGEKSIVAVYVYFSDLSVTINDKQDTWVNGKKVTLPSLHGNNVSVRVIEKTIVIEGMSGFQLSYSNTQEVIVTVGDSMVGKLCGACDKLLPSRDTMGLSQAMMQEYMATFAAQDFPTCEL
ncbi:IgGFc-binding protein-like [Thunnus albacares]|uniref:IgGFc-binding protein-like n=1 Tax=Thunnus albacares TaxID=8236 RepID=UPI001CF60601|nr:IgGFc-binding protein-like [Thunnus albacares]